MREARKARSSQKLMQKDLRAKGMNLYSHFPYLKYICIFILAVDFPENVL